MTKRKSVFVCLMLAIFSFILIGCKQNIKVENIYFNAPSSDGVVLLVGETYTPEVYFSPRYPTNRAYKIISYNDSIVTSRNNQITALTAGKTYIRVVADENELIQDIMQVQVVSSVTKLSTPTVAYSADKQAFTISQSNQDGFVNGYVIEINGESINIGNVLEYSLADYNKHLQSSTSTSGISAYDRDLTVRVKATVPTYTNAFEDSNFSETIKINQASTPKSVSVVGGKLNIEKSNAKDYQIYLNGSLISTTNKTSFDLSVVDKTLAGTSVQIAVRAVGTAGDGFVAYNSSAVNLAVKCVENLEVELLNETLSWQHINGIKSYAIYLGEQRIGITNSNFYNLKTYAGFETEFVPKNEAYKLTVKPVLDENVTNLILSSEQGSSIAVNRLATPAISCANNIVSWTSVENAQLYQVKVADSSGNVVYEIVTDKRKLDFTDEKFVSGESYVITVSANFVGGEICYIASTEASYNISKQNMAECEIVDYVLSFDAEIDNQYKIEVLDSEKQSIFSVTDNARTTRVQYNILALGIEFAAGKYYVQITHLGNDSTVVDAKTTTLEVVCLQAVDNISVNDGVVSAKAGQLNSENQAVLQFELLNGSTVVKTIENNTNLNELDLQSGEYTINLYVLGDGSHTFSVKNSDGTNKITASHKFTVLETPTITTQHSNAQFDINEVANATMYCVFGDDNLNFRLPANLTFEFELQAEERKEYQVQALGNGETTINSQLSKVYVFERLATPELNFNNTNNSVTSNLTSGYKLSLNGVDITSGYVFGQTLTGLVEGANTIEIVALAQDDTNVVYINSMPKQLVVNKAQANSKLQVVGNKLYIEPLQNVDNLMLELTISTASNTQTINENNFAEINPALDLKKEGNIYSINLLDEKYNAILSGLKGDLKVKVRYLANHGGENSDENVDTDYSPEQTISYAPVANFDMAVRDGQNVCFKISTGYSYNDYVLLLNNTFMTLDATVQLDSEAQTIKFDLSYIYKNVEEGVLQAINKLQLVTLNNKSTEENLMLSSLGEEIYFRKADSISMTSTKNNASATGNNSVIINFKQNETQYDRSVLVKVYNDIDDSTSFATLLYSVQPTEKSAIDYSFNLDDYGTNLTSVKKVVANIKATSNYTAEIDGKNVVIYVFDSELSNELEYVIVENASVTAEGTKLLFTLPENVDGVDVYKVEETGLTKLNTNIITDYYDFGANQGNLNLVIKTVATTNGNFTNSQLSKVISLTKLAQPAVKVENGYIVITLDQKAVQMFESTTFEPTIGIESLDGCVVRFVNNTVGEVGYIYFGEKGVELKDCRLIVDPSLVLKYGVSALSKEIVKFDAIAHLSTGDLVLNSNETTIELYGLFAPTNVNLSHSSLSWTDTGLNKLTDETNILDGYTFKLVDAEGNEYFSNTNLYYLTEVVGKIVETRYSKVISSKNASFPAGYFNAENNPVPFEAGTYSVYVKSMPKSGIEGYNLCASRYSEVCKIVILETPTLYLNEGVVSWEKVAGATEYLLTFVDINDNSIKQSVALTENKFEFVGFDNLVGNYNIYAKAVSKNNNVVDSAESEQICVHRLPTYESLTVDDGVVVIKANGYFVQANLMFRNNTTGVVETVIYVNPDYTQNISEFKSQGKTTWADTDVDTLNATKNYVVTIEDSYLLKLSKGNYSLSVKLIGNTTNDFAIVNSTTKTESNITKLTKLAFDTEKSNAEEKTWIRVDERGVFTFASPEEFALGGFNYAFNEQLTDVDYTGFKNVVIYKIVVNINNTPYEMFAIDYKSYLTAQSMFAQDLIVNIENAGTLCAAVKYPHADANGETKYLYFNVFKDNQINLNLDNFYYFNTTIATKDGTISLASGLNASNEQGFYTISLIEGGVFSVDLHIVGCDIMAVNDAESTTYQAYLSSDLYSSKSFIRYTDNNLKSYISYTVSNKQPEEGETEGEQIAENQTNGGEETENPTDEVVYTYSGELIFQNKIKYDKDGNVLDYPVYLLEINPIVYYDGTAVETKPYIYYLYHNHETVEQVILNNPAGDCVETKAVQVETLIENNDYLKFDFSKYFAPGNYSIKIRTLAGVGTDNLDSKYLLNSRLPSIAYSFKRLSNTNLQVVDGKLQFALAYVLNDRVQTFITDYEFVVNPVGAEETEYSFKIGQTSQGVSVVNNVLTYILPTTVQATNKATNQVEELGLQNGTKYNIKVRAVQSDAEDTGILNSTFVQTAGQDKVTTIEKSQGIETVRIIDGVICWVVKDQANYNGTIIRFEFEDGRVVEETISAERTLSKTIDGQTYFYYEVGDNEYTCIDGVGKSRINAGVYNIKLRTRGKFDSTNNVEILLSNFTDAQEMVRLARVEANAIVSTDGILTWQHADAEHISGYIVNIIGTESYTFTTSENSIDFASTSDDNGKKLAVGSYSITIRAIGGDYITSMVSSTVASFTKLGTITKVTEDGDAISWDKVENAQGYNITFIWGEEGSTQSTSTIVKAEDGLRCVAPESMSGSYTIKIQAVGVGSGKVFNGEEFVFEGSNERPQSVGEIKFDETDLSLYISISDDFKTNDVLTISYNIAAYQFGSSGSFVGTAEEKIVELSKADTNNIKVIDNVTYFVYPLTTAGVYTNIAVNVVRKDSLSSVTAVYDNIDFNYFGSGDGSAENPYGLANANQFANVALKADKHFVMLQAISLAEIDAREQIKKYGALIANKFTGSLDGKDFALFGLENVEVSNSGLPNFAGLALFNKIENAIIKNINIAETNNNLTKFVNTFAQQQSNVLKLSTIAMEAINSTLINITLKNAMFEITGSRQLVNKGYIGGLVAMATSTTFEGCVVDLTVKFASDFVPTSGGVYIGGLVASGSNITVQDSDIRQTTVAFSAEQTYTDRYFKSVGGVAGETSSSSVISNVASTISQTTNIYAENFGGIVGNASNTNITGCTVLGSFVNNALGTTNLGGVVGQLMGGSVDNCRIKITFNLSIAKFNQIYVGFVAGYVTSNNGVMAAISNCKINQAFTTSTQFSSDYKSVEKMGIYGGSSQNNYNPTGCTQIN